MRPHSGVSSSGILVSTKVSHSWKVRAAAGWKLPAYQLGKVGTKPGPAAGLSNGLPAGPYLTPSNTSLAQLPREAQSVLVTMASSRYWKPVATEILPAQFSNTSPDMPKSRTSWRVLVIAQGKRPLAPGLLPS